MSSIELNDNDRIDTSKARGMDDAAEARWFDINNLPSPLAFDHEKIIKDALNQ